MDHAAIDEKLRGIASTSDRVERLLRETMGDIEGGRVIAARLVREVSVARALHASMLMLMIRMMAKKPRR